MTSSDPERWAPIPDWDGLYEVSDLGRVRSLPRVVPTRTRWHSRLVERRVGGGILRATPDTHGYARVFLTYRGQRRQLAVHRLVLEAFVGPCPPDMEGCHGPGGQADNRLVNLRWDTRRENAYDRVRHGTHYLVNSPTCKRGHDLAGNNLLADATRQGRRGCLACFRATQAWARLADPERAAIPDRERWLQQRADEALPAIVGGATQKPRIPVDVARCVELYRVGHSTIAIAALLQRPAPTIYRALVQAGEPRRPVGRPPRRTGGAA